MVYSRPFASKAVFWAILNEFEFAVDCQRRAQIHSKSLNKETTQETTQETTFEAKGRLCTTGKVIQRLFIIDLYT